MSEAIDHGFIHSIYSFDPNGIPIEFSHNVKSVDIRKKPRLVDSAPSVITREGPEPRPDHWPPVEKPTPPQERKVYPGEGREILHEEKNKW